MSYTPINERGIKNQFLYILASSETTTPKAEAVKDFAATRLQRQTQMSVVRSGIGMAMTSPTVMASPTLFRAGALGLRILPVVGYAMLAYDLWSLYERLSE